MMVTIFQRPWPIRLGIKKAEHMKTQLFGLSKAAAAVQILGVGLLLLISCNNFLTPPQEGGLEGNGETGTVLLSFGNGIEGARTLLPGGVSFPLYRLTITPVAPTTGSTVQHDSLPSGTITLPAGTWNIHVDAYTDAGGTNKAAEGDSGTITVNAYAVTQVNITLRSIISGGTGTLSVNISDGGGGIQDGDLYIFTGTNFDIPVNFNGGSDVENFGSGGLITNITLAAGQYRVAVYISNTKGQFYMINEVAYICRGLTTGLTRSITSGDFSGGAGTTEISGTVQYSDNSTPQSGYTVKVFGGHEGIMWSLDEVSIDSTGSQPYTLSIPRPDKEVTLSFEVEKDGYSIHAGDLVLSSGQTAATKDISLNVITLSGTVGVTIGGSPPDSVGVYAHTEGGGFPYFAVVNSGNWTMKVPSDATYLFFSAEVRYGEQWASLTDISWEWTSGSSTNDINLTGAFVRVSGSFSATENEIPISNENVQIFIFGPVSYWSSWYEWAGTTCNWIVNAKAPSPQTVVNFNITIGSGIIAGGNTVTEPVTLGTSNITIPHRTYTFNTSAIAGTVANLSGGLLVIFATPVTTHNDFLGQWPQRLGSAEITSGGFSGSVPSGFSSGYVVIDSSPDGNADGMSYSPSPVPLNTSMNLNFSTMTPVTPY
jgi:hypothetical protein